MFIFQAEAMKKPREGKQTEQIEIESSLHLERNILKVKDDQNVSVRGKAVEANPRMGSYREMKNLHLYNATLEDVIAFCEQVIPDKEQARKVAEYFYYGVKAMLGITEEIDYNKIYNQLRAEGMDEEEAKRIVAAMNPAYWAIQYLANLLPKAAAGDSFVLGRITYYFANPTDEGGLGKDVFGNPVSGDERTSQFGATNQSVSTYFGYNELKKAIINIYNSAQEMVEEKTKKLKQDLEEKKKELKKEVPSLLTDEQLEQLKEEGRTLIKLADGGLRVAIIGSLDNPTEMWIATGENVQTITFGQQGEKQGGEQPQNRPSPAEAYDDLDQAIGELKATQKRLSTLVQVLEAAKNAKETGQTQQLDPKAQEIILNATSEELGQAFNDAGVSSQDSEEAAKVLKEECKDGQITAEEARELEKAMGISFDEAIQRLDAKITELENQIALLEQLQQILLLMQAVLDLDEIKTTHDTNPKQAINTMRKKELALYASLIEKEKEFWKKYRNLRSAYEYAKSKKPPALKRFIREFSDTVKGIGEMARRLELIERVAKYSIALISFSQAMENAGQFATEEDLLNFGYRPEQFSNLVKAEKKPVLKLGENVLPTLVFFGIFNYEKGKLSLSKKGEKYLREWAKKNNYDFYKIKGELLTEFSNGLLSSVGQSFLAFAAEKAMEENGITDEDMKNFKQTQTDAKTLRAILSERTKELAKRIDALGAESLVLRGPYEKNYKIAMGNLERIYG